MYHTLVYIHVLSAIVALGCNATYAVWLVRGSMEKQHLLFALRGIKFMDDRIANPAYALLAITGIAQVVLSGRSFMQGWIVAAIVLFVILAIIAFAGFTPALKQQIAILERGGPDDPAYPRAESRQRVLGIVLMVLALVIVALMVFRPGGY